MKKLELKVHGNFYRAEKLKLYTDCINLELGKGQVLGAMGVTKEDETLIPMDPSGEMLPESCEAKLVEEIDRFTFHSTFKKGQLVLLMLEQGEEAHQYFISTSKTDFKAMCVGTFLDESSLSEEALKRNTKTAINKAGLSGTYDIRVVIDDKKYETGMQITC